MDGLKTKTNSYVDDESYCIAGISAIPEKGFYRIYVAWEWKDQADRQIFGIVRSRTLFKKVNEKSIRETCDYGWEISHYDQKELEKIMPWLI